MNVNPELEERLRRLSQPGLTATQREAIWRRARHQALAMAAPAPVRRVGLTFRFAVAFMVLLACLGAAIGGSAWPGQPLYTTRRSAETMLLALLPLDAQGPLRLELLNQRTRELAHVVDAHHEVPPSLVEELETSFWTLSTYPQLWGLRPGQVLAYVERNRQVYLELAYRYPNLQGALRLLTVSSLARDRLWEGWTD